VKETRNHVSRKTHVEELLDPHQRRGESARQKKDALEGGGKSTKEEIGGSPEISMKRVDKRRRAGRLQALGGRGAHLYLEEKEAVLVRRQGGAVKRTVLQKAVKKT